MDNNRSKDLSYGFSLFSISLLSRWCIGNSLFIGTEGLLRFGIIEILAFSSAGFFAFLTIIPISRRITNTINSSSLLEILDSRLSVHAKEWMRKLLFIGLVFNLILIDYTAGILLNAFSIPVYVGMPIYFLIGLMLAVFLKQKWFTSYNMINVGVSFLLLIMLLVHSYLLEGIQVVYNGVSLFHPYLLFISWGRFPFLLLAFWCVIFGILMTDPQTWSIVLNHKGTKKELGLFVTGFLWGTIPFSFAMIAFSAIYSGGFSSVSAVFQKIFIRYGQMTVTVLLVSLLLLIVTGSFFSGLRTFFIFNNKNDKNINKRFWSVVLIFVVVIPFSIKVLSLSLLDLFLIFGSFFAASIPVICHLLLQNKQQGISTVIVIMMATLTGWIFYYLGIYEFSVLGSFTFSLGATALLHFIFQTKEPGHQQSFEG